MNRTTHKNGGSVLEIETPKSRILYDIQCMSDNIGWRSYDDFLRVSLTDTKEAVVGLSRWHKGHTFRIVKVVVG